MSLARLQWAEVFIDNTRKPAKMWRGQFKVYEDFTVDVSQLKFNYYDSKEWKEYLLEWRHPQTGKKLPRINKSGRPICYFVCIIGVPKVVQVQNGYKSSIMNVFPGRKPGNNHKLPIHIYGVLI